MPPPDVASLKSTAGGGFSFILRGLAAGLLILLSGCVMYSPSGPHHPLEGQVEHGMSRDEALARISTGYCHRVESQSRPSSGWSVANPDDTPSQAMRIEKEKHIRVKRIDTIHLYYSSFGYTRWRLYITAAGKLAGFDRERFN
jgi:hypothetical protein